LSRRNAPEFFSGAAKRINSFHRIKAQAALILTIGTDILSLSTPMRWQFPVPLIVLAVSVAAHAIKPAACAADPMPAEVRTNGFLLGTQSYTFKNFTFEEACAKTASTGVHTTELFPGQKISAALPDQKTGPGVSPEGMAAMKEILKKNKLTAVAVGVIGIPNNEDGARKIFEFAKELGIRVINTESTESIDIIEKMVKEFDIRVGYHNHPQRPDNPNYKVWDPNYILELTQGRDPRIGSCADLGHWTNSGLAAADCIKILKSRIVSSHLKDIAHGSRSCTRPGTGRAKLDEALRALKSVEFDGPISIEHEINWEDNVEDVKSYVTFVKELK
jgi:sugar phosphate isomerase/epimerase